MRASPIVKDRVLPFFLLVALSHTRICAFLSLTSLHLLFYIPLLSLALSILLLPVSLYLQFFLYLRTNPFILFLQCGPRSASLWYMRVTHTPSSTRSHTRRARAHIRRRTHIYTVPFENWCHEAKRGGKYIDIHVHRRRMYIGSGLSVCSRQLIMICASLGKYSVN